MVTFIVHNLVYSTKP